MGKPAQIEIPAIFEAAIGAARREAEASNDGLRRTGTSPLLAHSRSETSTGLVHRRSAATHSQRAQHPPQVAFAQVSYSIRSPLIALEMTSCWICSVPSKMSMVSRMRLSAPRESVTCGSVRPRPSVPPESAEF